MNKQIGMEAFKKFPVFSVVLSSEPNEIWNVLDTDVRVVKVEGTIIVDNDNELYPNLNFYHTSIFFEGMTSSFPLDELVGRHRELAVSFCNNKIMESVTRAELKQVLDKWYKEKAKDWDDYNAHYYSLNKGLCYD